MSNRVQFWEELEHFHSFFKKLASLHFATSCQPWLGWEQHVLGQLPLEWDYFAFFLLMTTVGLSSRQTGGFSRKITKGSCFPCFLLSFFFFFSLHFFPFFLLLFVQLICLSLYVFFFFSKKRTNNKPEIITRPFEEDWVVEQTNKSLQFPENKRNPPGEEGKWESIGVSGEFINPLSSFLPPFLYCTRTTKLW